MAARNIGIVVDMHDLELYTCAPWNTYRGLSGMEPPSNLQLGLLTKYSLAQKEHFPSEA